MPNTPNAIARKILRCIERFAESKTVDSYPVSVAFGLATKESSYKTITELFSDAEQKMYKDKIHKKPLDLI